MTLGPTEDGWYLLCDYEGATDVFVRLEITAINNTQLGSQTKANQAARELMAFKPMLSNPRVVWINSLKT